MKHLAAAAALTLLASPALAHPGDHAELTGLPEAMRHLFGSPLHAALLLGLGVAVFALVKGLKKRKTQKTD